MINYLLLGILFFISGCEKKNEHRLKVAASSIPHAEILQAVQNDLKEKGIELVIVVTDDYNLPNRALASGEVDANFFQHLPFLDMQIKEFGYPIKSIASVEIEPMGIYSRKIHQLTDVKEGMQVAIPSDPTNEARALLLLQQAGLIELVAKNILLATPHHIVENKKSLHFIEVDPAMLPRALDDVDLAVINTNYALQAGLSPLKDALLLEGNDSPYVNVLVIRDEDSEREEIIELKKALQSTELREFILHTYQGEVLPAF